jgi:hypothetical protein
MAVRLLITDTAWAAIAPRLAAIKHSAGSPPELRHRLFIEPVLSVARTGVPLARSAAGVWPLGCGVQPLPPLGRPGHLAATLGVPAPGWLSCGPTPLY